MKHIGRIIRLNRGERRVAQRVAKWRTDSSRVAKASTASKFYKGQDIEKEGFGGELAFCKMFNVYPEISTLHKDDAHDTGDATLSDGRTVDVKTTSRIDGSLIAARWKTRRTDLHALMVGKFPEYTFKGFMRSKDFLRKSRLVDLGYGPTYVAEQSELKELSALK